MLEELDLKLEGLHQIGILENVFEYEGQAGHEILFVMGATFRIDAVTSSLRSMASKEAVRYA